MTQLHFRVLKVPMGTWLAILALDMNIVGKKRDVTG
jgi:hypothetical protein